MNEAPSFKGLLRDNRWYLTAFTLALLLGGAILLRIQTGDEIFFFSDRRSYWGDWFFKYFTQMGEGLAYVLALAGLLFLRYRSALALPLLGFSVSVVSFLSKSFFAHDRPAAFFRKLGILDQIHLVDGVTLASGPTSFPSGHTMSAFALYSFLAFCLPRKRWTALLLFAMALLVGVSRIYLVQHFLQDVYLGAIMGILIALIWYYLQFLPKAHWMDRNLLSGRGPLAEE